MKLTKESNNAGMWLVCLLAIFLCFFLVVVHACVYENRVGFFICVSFTCLRLYMLLVVSACRCVMGACVHINSTFTLYFRVALGLSHHVLARLVIACSAFDSRLAEKHASLLPSVAAAAGASAPKVRPLCLWEERVCICMYNYHIAVSIKTLAPFGVCMCVCMIIISP